MRFDFNKIGLCEIEIVLKNRSLGITTNLPKRVFLIHRTCEHFIPKNFISVQPMIESS